MTEQSKPNENKSIDDIIHDFCQDLQKADLGLNKLIRNGYLLYGQTRSGKTAASHLLSGNALKGIKIAGEQKVENSTTKYKNAKIGNTPVSQTRVPNLFEVKNPIKPEEKVHVIDTPGYGDTHGIFRLLGNGYYHYKLYSKVQNMKFILCFDQIQLQNTGQLFIDTIVQFTSYFKDYADHKEQIWRSCVFLINKVDENVFSLEDLKTKMREIHNSIKIQKSLFEIELIKQFINFILKQDRIFTIKKYRLGDSATRADLLKAIDEKCSWWQRKLNPKNQNEVEMEPILFNIVKPILVELTRNDLSQHQFINLVEYYNDKINQILLTQIKFQTNKFSLDYVFNELVKDAMGKPDSHNFLESMKNYIDKYSHIYDKNYKEARQNLQKEMFQSEKDSLGANSSILGKASKIKDKNFIVKKFQVLSKVEKLKQAMNHKYQVQYQVQQNYEQKSLAQKNEERTKAIIEMIREFNKVSYKRKNCPEIIYKYGYMIYRVLSEVQVLLLLMGSGKTNTYDLKFGTNKIIEAAEGKFLSLTPLTSFMGLSYKYGKDQPFYTIEELKVKYIQQIDLNSEQFSKVTINWALVDLFSSTEINNQNPQIIMQKIVVLLEKFSEQFLTEKQTQAQNYNDTVKLIQKLTTAQVNLYQLIELSVDQDRKDQFLFITRRVTGNIGQLLESIQKYSIGRQVYNSILDVDQVCNLFKKQIEIIDNSVKNEKKNLKSQENKPFRLRIEYGIYLRNHGRDKESIIIFQKAFKLASNKNELMEIKGHLSDALLGGGTEIGNKDLDPNVPVSYQQNLFSNVFYTKFSDDLINELQNLEIRPLTQSKIIRTKK